MVRCGTFCFKIAPYIFHCLRGLAPLFYLAGCGIDVAIQSNRPISLAGLSGKVVLSSGLLSQNAKFCTAGKVRIFELNSDGTKKSLHYLAQTSMRNDGTYQFENLESLGITFTEQNQYNFLLEFTGCSKTLHRSLTGFSEQDISHSSTLISYLWGTSARARMLASTQFQTQNVNNLIKSLDIYTSIEQAYSALAQNAQLKANFTKLFSADPAILMDASPWVVKDNVPAEISERVATNFSVESVHWNSSYPTLYQWSWNGNSIGTTPTFSYNPGANEQGNHNLILKIGRNDGSNQIDTTKPTFTKEYVVKVANSILPQVPTATLTSISPTNNTSVSVDISTGVNKVNCESFSNLAITENTSAPPALVAFTYTCTVDGTQTLNYTLVDDTDGAKILRLWTADNSGTISLTPQSIALHFDGTAPNLLIESPAANTVFQTSFVITGACESHLPVNLGGSGIVATTASCVDDLFTATLTATPGNGIKSVIVSQTDAVGNIASIHRNYIQAPPAGTLTLTNPVARHFSQTSVTIGGACLSGFPVNISGAGLVASYAPNCISSTYSQLIVMTEGDGEKHIDISQVDGMANTTNLYAVFNVDNTAPIPNEIIINNGQTNTNNKNIVLKLSADSNQEDISAFCVKMNDSSAPNSAHTCWKTLASIGNPIAQHLSISNYPSKTGSLLGTYTFYVWYKDLAGNISTRTGVNGVDQSSIFYSPNPPPVISIVTAASSNSATLPFSDAHLTAPLGTDLFVKWNATDDQTIPSGSIKIEYSFDENTFTPLVSGLNNSANGGCSIDTSYTGCVRLPNASPSDAYFRLRLTITDSGGMQSINNSNSLNTEEFKSLSGNTSLGLGGSATSAILLGRFEDEYSTTRDNHAFTVHSNGQIFFNYSGKGLAYLSPTSGSIEIVAQQTGTSTGDGGPLSSATFRNIKKIFSDHDGNLYIWDYNRVRKVDLAQPNWPINTLFGGGGSTATGEPALNASIPVLEQRRLLVALPNGNIFFEQGKAIRYFKKSDNTVNTYTTVTGVGMGSMTGGLQNFEWDNCQSDNTAIGFNKTTSIVTRILRRGNRTTSAICGNRATSEDWIQIGNFNPSTGAAQAPHPPSTGWRDWIFPGMNGSIYKVSDRGQRMALYNTGTNAWVNVLGSNSSGRCVDGTPALSCATIIMDATVTPFGQIYFLDMGVLRTILEDGTIATVAGQPRNFGINHPPESARYSKVFFFDVNDDDIYVKNKLEGQIVKFNLLGGNLEHVAGNGIQAEPTADQPAVTQPLQNCNWERDCAFIVDGVNKKLYHRRGSTFGYIDLDTKLWKDVGTSLQADTFVSYLGKNTDGTVLTHMPSDYTAGSMVTLREINPIGNMTTVYGKETVLASLSGNLCNNQTGTDCTFLHVQDNSTTTQYKYDEDTDEWLIAMRERAHINTLPQGGGTTRRLLTLPKNLAAFDYKYEGADRIIFYCSSADSKLYRINATTLGVTPLPLPSATLACDGNALHYHKDRDSLIFIYKQNGLYGIGEYANP